MPSFTHLHCHTQYSLLDGATDIAKMMDKAQRDGQKGVALTDHGNMFGAFEFVNAANKRGLKPIVGCEFYLVKDRHKKQFLRSKNEEDVRYHQLLLAKNRKGYENLSKLCSLGYIEGLYGKYPRIDKELLAQYSEGLIATSCCIGAEVPQTIIHHGAERAEEVLKWWLDLFGTDDYYIEIQRHRGMENMDGLGISQEDVNQVLLGFAKKYNLKVICTNDSHYLEEEDASPHDILLCVNTNSLLEEKDRFRFPSSDFYFKTQDEMNRLFGDVPQAVDFTQEILDKVEPLQLVRDVLLPAFPIPAGFDSQDDYLRHLTFEGAKKRYGSIDAATEERLNFELNVIKNSGYPGYFLIVQDFTSTARQMGVWVGPGRGSAAGSAVAYCTGITNVDPIKYDLLFERFLNPERVSMPDIDIDFDDVGRDKVIDYVVKKYGKMQVAQIVTYGTMAAKSSLRDVGRVMNVPLGEVDKVAKSFPQQLGATLADVLGAPESELRDKFNSADDVDKALKFRQLAQAGDDIAQMINTARKLEGSVRNTGIHACGVIITPDDITNYVPVTVAKDSELLVSQFDNSVAESAGLLKMDFLGLKTLTIIKDAVRIVEETTGTHIEPDDIPLDDTKTYELFQRGETVAIFQYESAGMQKYMKELKPTTFEDLIAMNALYRPGPLAYIPDFIARKHGRQVITYDLEAMKEYLHETYGICVTGDTLVFNPKTGKRTRIDQLENEVGEYYVQGVNDNLETEFAKISYWVCNGKKQVFEVKLRNGSKVKMTSNHQVLTENGWKKLEELKVGDAIATPRKLEVINAENYDRKKLRVLAYLLADGSLRSALAADFVSKSPVLIDEYQNCLSSFENIEPRTLEQIRGVTRVMVAGVNKERYHEPNSLISYLRELGLKTMREGCWSGDKFVPEFVFGLNNEDIAFFIASLWDCDGCVAPRLLHFKTISQKLAYDVQTLLLRLGISSTIYETHYFNNRRKQEITAYQVTVYNLKAFKELIEPHMIFRSMPDKEYSGLEVNDALARELFIDELNEAWKGSARGLMEKYGFDRQQLYSKAKKRSRISVQVVEPLTEVLDMPRTKRNMNVRWEEIISIEPTGEELVYDITVENIHNFIGNNIILHNCVYQEQVMLLSQKLASFTKGEADVLRKAMGKKQKAVLDKMYPKFLEGCEKNGHPKSVCEKIWKDWEAFASYAFNKSHSTCYALLGFQTAYLKANYPAAFMAAVLTNAKDNITEVSKFLRECNRMGVPVLGPDINESASDFTVNREGQIRFGMSALKGVGEGPVEDILREREKNGAFKSIFDFVKRLDTKAANKKVLESLVLGGAFDRFEDTVKGTGHRAQFFAPSGKYDSFNEHLLAFGSGWQERQASAAMSLFGSDSSAFDIPEPEFPKALPWSLIEKLEREKEVTGIYISGHPLDNYRMEMENFITCTLEEIEERRGQPVKIAGIVIKAQHKISQKGTGWGAFTLQDYHGTLEITLFSDDYMKFKGFFEQGNCVFVTGVYEARWGRDDEFSLKVKEVTLLENAGKNLAKSVTVKINVEDLTQELIDKLDALCKEHRGSQLLKVTLLDFANKTSLNFSSKSRKVNVGNEFVSAVKGLGVECGVG